MDQKPTVIGAVQIQYKEQSLTLVMLGREKRGYAALKHCKIQE